MSPSLQTTAHTLPTDITFKPSAPTFIQSLTPPNGPNDTPAVRIKMPATPETTPERRSTPDSIKNDHVMPASPPVQLTKTIWAPKTRFKLNRPRFRTTGLALCGKWGAAMRSQDLNKMYGYTRIPQHQVRLLLIKSGAFDDPINAHLMVVNDDELGNCHYPYTALSYNWGEKDADNTIIIQDDPRSRPVKSVDDVFNSVYDTQENMLMIKPNLHEALRHLRKEDEVVALWVDALCINQLDDAEKNEQVAKMALIYHKAYNVNIWLGVDGPGYPVSGTAMSFIREVINPESHARLLKDDTVIKGWASLFELLRWSWFSRRWVIQELAVAQDATVHCGEHSCPWSEFQNAIGVFREHFKVLKPKLIEDCNNTLPGQGPYSDDSVFEIEQLGARLLVDMKANLFRTKRNGNLESTQGLETLVCSLSGFDTSDPRDTINALRNISREVNRPDSDTAQLVPVPDYSKDLFQIYRDFVKWAIESSESLDIICRHWALKERKTRLPSTPRLVRLPSWIQFVEDSAWGKGEDLFSGRMAGDPFVGLPEYPVYHASGRGSSYKRPKVRFPRSVDPNSSFTTLSGVQHSSITHDMSLLVNGVAIGTVIFRTDPFPDKVIPEKCLQKLGWTSDAKTKEVTTVPPQLWRTLVADRAPDGKRTAPFYENACSYCLRHLPRNGHLSMSTILQQRSIRGNQEQQIVHKYLERVSTVTLNRSFIEGSPINTNGPTQSDEATENLVGFGPNGTETGDVIVILYGCSVPVILRPLQSDSREVESYSFVGEAYVYGKMDGEVFEEPHEEMTFKLV